MSLTISVCIPTYKAIDLIDDTLATVFAQTYSQFELIICNDSVADHEAMEAKLKAYQDSRILFYRNDSNLGYPLNIRKCAGLAKGQILFLLGQDDLILGNNLFANTVKFLEDHPEIGCITRPYYWFGKNPKEAIRMVPKYHKRVIGPYDSKEDLSALLETLGQLSGLVLRKQLITAPFNHHVFPAHIYPFLSILRTHKCYYWDDFTIAVRTVSSQTRFLSSIYNPSPTRTWVDMFKEIFPEERFRHFRETGIEKMTQNYIGLAQIKNYGHLSDFLKDTYYLLKYRPKNILNVRFWFYFLLCLLTPRYFLRRIVDSYKSVFNKWLLKKVQIAQTRTNSCTPL